MKIFCISKIYNPVSHFHSTTTEEIQACFYSYLDAELYSIKNKWKDTSTLSFELIIKEVILSTYEKIEKDILKKRKNKLKEEIKSLNDKLKEMEKVLFIGHQKTNDIFKELLKFANKSDSLNKKDNVTKKRKRKIMGYRRYYKSFRFNNENEDFDTEEKQINFIKSFENFEQNDLNWKPLEDLLDIHSNQNIFWNEYSSLNGKKSYFLINSNEKFNKFLESKKIYCDGFLSELYASFNGYIIIKTIDILQWFFDEYINSGYYKKILGKKLSCELEEMINDDNSFYKNKINRIPFGYFISAYGHKHWLNGRKIFHNGEVKFWYALSELLERSKFDDYIYMEEF